MELVSALLDRRHSHNISSRGQKLILIFIVAGIISLAQLSSIIVVRSVDMLFLTHGGVCPWGHLTGMVEGFEWKTCCPWTFVDAH